MMKFWISRVTVRKWGKLQPVPKAEHLFYTSQILDVLRVDDKKFSVMLNMYFGVYWTEERMEITENAPDKVNWLPIDMEFMKHLWVPNVFVYNLVDFQHLQCLQKLAGLWIVGDKELFYNQVRKYK